MKARSVQTEKSAKQPLPWLPLAYSEKDAAVRLGVPLHQFRRLAEADHFPVKVIESGYLVRRTDLEAYLAGQIYDPIRRRWRLGGKQAPVTAGTVYVIGFSAYVKIGFTAQSVLTRLAQIQTGAPERLTVLAEIPAEPAVERALHQRFAGLRSYGEWFRRDGDLAEWIEKGCPVDAA